MTDPLTELARSQPDKLALVDDRPDGTLASWTYQELEAQTNALARVFRDAGAKAGNRIIWCGPNSRWVVAAGIAARKLGAVAVPLNYRLTAEEAAYVVDNSDAVLVFADAEYADLFAEIHREIPQVQEVIVFDGPARAGQAAAEERLALVSTDELVVDVDQQARRGARKGRCARTPATRPRWPRS